MDVAKELGWLEARKQGCSTPPGYMDRYKAFLKEIEGMGGPKHVARTCDKALVLDSARKFLYSEGYLEAETKHRFTVMGGPLRVRQIYYLKEQEDKLIPNIPSRSGYKCDWVHPYFNESLDITLEHRVIRECIEAGDHQGTSYWGVFPWDYGKEANRDPYRIERTILAHAKRGVTMLSMYGPKGDNRDFFHKMEAVYHKPEGSTRMDLMQALCEGIGKQVPTLKSSVTFVSYRSTWFMTPNLVEHYVKNWLGPALDLIENDSTIRELALGPTNYKDLGERLENAWGRKGTDWPAAPFVLERLLSWFATVERHQFGYL